MAKETKWLYLPIDVRVREIEAKTLLALRAAKRGYHSVIGQKSKFDSIARFFPPGQFLGFGAMENMGEYYKKIKSCGHNLILMDEEGLVSFNPEVYQRTKLSKTAMACADVFVCWGEKQKGMVNIFEEKVIVTGNPRIDILRSEFKCLYKYDVDSIREKYGSYILINSNFGSCNHFLGRDVYFESLKTKKVILNNYDEKYYQDYFEYRSELMNYFSKMILDIKTEFPNHSIIIRPHPSENHDFWLNVANGNSKIHVINEGSVNAWIKGADCMIHNFCTTAIEAFFLGVSPVSYAPIKDELLQTDLPSLVSVEVNTIPELLNAVRQIIVNKDFYAFMRKEKEEILSRYAYSTPNAYASDQILNAMEGLNPPQRWSSIKKSYNFGLFHLFVFGKFVKQVIFRRRFNADYIVHKFTPLKKSDLINIIKGLETFPGEYDAIDIQCLDQNCFVLSL